MAAACWLSTFRRRFASVVARRPSPVPRPRKSGDSSMGKGTLSGRFPWMCMRWRNGRAAQRAAGASGASSETSRRRDGFPLRHQGEARLVVVRFAGSSCKSCSSCRFSVLRRMHLTSLLPPFPPVQSFDRSLQETTEKTEVEAFFSLSLTFVLRWVLGIRGRRVPSQISSPQSRVPSHQPRVTGFVSSPSPPRP